MQKIITSFYLKPKTIAMFRLFQDRLTMKSFLSFCFACLLISPYAYGDSDPPPSLSDSIVITTGPVPTFEEITEKFNNRINQYPENSQRCIDFMKTSVKGDNATELLLSENNRDILINVNKDQLEDFTTCLSALGIPEDQIQRFTGIISPPCQPSTSPCEVTSYRIEITVPMQSEFYSFTIDIINAHRELLLSTLALEVAKNPEKVINSLSDLEDPSIRNYINEHTVMNEALLDLFDFSCSEANIALWDGYYPRLRKVFNDNFKDRGLDRKVCPTPEERG